MPEHPSEMFLLIVFLVSPDAQLKKSLADPFLEHPVEKLEGGLHGMLTSLPVPLLERLGEVEELREPVGKLQRLEAPCELESLAAQGLADLNSQVPLLVALGESLGSETPQGLDVLSSQIISKLCPLEPLLSGQLDLHVPEVIFDYGVLDP